MANVIGNLLVTSIMPAAGQAMGGRELHKNMFLSKDVNDKKETD